MKLRSYLGEARKKPLHDAQNAIRDMFLSRHYNQKVPVADMNVVLSSARWAKIYGKANMKKAWNSFVKEKYVKRSGEYWLWGVWESEGNLGSSLDRLRDLTSSLVESDLFESLKGTYADYMGGASSNFLKAAIPGIKKIAGGHAESVNVRRGAGSDYAVLEYVGQDRSDNDLKVSISVFPGSDFNANIFFQVSTIRGHHQEDISIKSGVLTPDVIVRKFRSVFGI